MSIDRNFPGPQCYKRIATVADFRVISSRKWARARTQEICLKLSATAK